MVVKKMHFLEGQKKFEADSPSPVTFSLFYLPFKEKQISSLHCIISLSFFSFFYNGVWMYVLDMKEQSVRVKKFPSAL